ncbi:uncharacterized protein F4822DRAFT_108989 [Hypoxylon trugodes]|uniref:uncharacterized protein n=1 Tax=Hypoxylon trugodes TaxID=326681 RepID=UPI002190E0DD|nr:uncharacterized protein F4822DRAFT_108989 [Hypoxylon trugodes]KAI1391901.1 hypothetical protein F4822DRAFT_108989 [Hypoxylon trugodes]
MSSTNKHPLRKSCGFCRSRKIKCSNETICEACRKQGVDCIYDFEPYQSSSRSASISQADRAAHRAGSQHPSPRLGSEEDSARNTAAYATSDIGTELESMFYARFLAGSPRNNTNSNAYQQKISAFNRAAQRAPASPPTDGHFTPTFDAQTAKYSGLLSLLTQDLVGLTVAKFGSLGCQLVESGGARFLVDGLRSDHTESMFDPPPQGQNPLAEYGSRKISQIIDVWFSTHPLSFLLSKTLVMHELRGETLDETLLAVILADANFFIGDDVSVARGHLLLRHATSKLRTQQFCASGLSESSQPGAPQSILPHPTIATVQAITLLGWNALCQSQIRRATCYIGLAGRLATALKEQKWSTTTAGPGSRINGIDVCEVEKEMVAYLWWITFALTQWLFMQMDQQLPYLPRASLTSVFLPADASSSVLIRLDEASDNLSTLQRQKATMMDIWPLAHISSVVAYIFALYPQDMPPSDQPEALFWQEMPLFALGRIQNGTVPQTLGLVCREIHRVLIENIHILDSKINYTSSRTLVLAVYLTIAIHILFPQSADNFADSILTGDVMDRFCTSAEELIKIITAASETSPNEPLFRRPTQMHPCSPEIFTIALDSCARALSRIQSRKGAANNVELYALYEPRLRALAVRLEEIAQYQSFSPGPALRVVRRHLKSITLEFGVISPITGSHWRSNSTSSLSINSISNMADDFRPPIPRALSQSMTPSHSMTPSLTSSPQLSDTFTPPFVPMEFQYPLGNSNMSMPGDSEKPGSKPEGLFLHIGDHPAHNGEHDPNGTMHPANMGEMTDEAWYQDEPAMMDFDMNTAELNGPIIWQNWSTLA